MSQRVKKKMSSEKFSSKKLQKMKNNVKNL